MFQSKYCEFEPVKYRIFRVKFSALKLLISFLNLLNSSSSSKILEFSNSMSPFSRVLSPSFLPEFDSGLENNFSNLDFESKFSVLDLWLRLLPPVRGLSPKLEFSPDRGLSPKMEFAQV